ncbi:MAG TPA: ABC transporter permease subunit [Pirellulales bacterium]|jgi:ABC-type transport system involved in multi-copper enzyme maturation permease subunit|nr:ABC transporter permease subunit [Pirellulales bacterium]
MSTIRWLIRDTFRQSLAYGIFWILLAVSVLTIGVCLSVKIEGSSALAAPGENPDFLPKSVPDAKDAAKLKQSGVAVVGGDLTLAFGAIRIPLERDDRHAVHFLQLLLAGGVADTLGLLLTLIWTAGFLPGFLDGRSVSVLLAKPAPRWVLLAGKYLGVLAFVLFHATLFVGGTWLAIGLRTGIWDATYLFAIPLLLLHFAVFFSVSLLLAVCTRSTVVCVFGSILFWCVAWGMNYGRHALAASAQLMPDGHFSSSVNWLVDLGYWILPKPADFGMLLYNALGAKDFFGPVFDMQSLSAHGFSIWLSVLTSLAFTGYILFASARKFAATDY